MKPPIVVTKVFVVEGVREEQVHLTQFPGASVEREVEARLVLTLIGDGRIFFYISIFF